MSGDGRRRRANRGPQRAVDADDFALNVSRIQLESVRVSADVILKCDFDRSNPACNPWTRKGASKHATR